MIGILQSPAAWRSIRDDRGAALIEFTITFPVLLVLLVLLAEGGRVMWYHQLITKSVRDATRYLTRVAEATDLCSAGGANPLPAAYLEAVRNLALRGAIDASEPYLNENWTEPETVQASVTCVDNTGGSYRGPSRLPLITVTATAPIDFPLARLFRLVGASPDTALTFTVVDQARHYGA